MSFATKEATFAYLKRFKNYSKDFYRFDGDRFISSLGIGTFRKEPYREENYTINYKEAIKKAVLGGINLIDTAINYRYQVSEQEIASALRELLEGHKIAREELVLTSKAGFLPLEFPFPKNPYEWIEHTIIDAGLASKEEIIVDQHCISPAYLRWSVEQSLENLGVATLDILFLHNPEFQLGYISYEKLKERIKEAFVLFEDLVKEGKIRDYGIASWNGFYYQEGHAEYMSVSDMVAIAREVGGKEHHFKYIQAPYNLAKTEALSYANQKGLDGKYYSLMQVLAQYGLSMMGSSSLLQMNLFKTKFKEDVGEALGTQDLNDIASALQFARSSAVVSSLFGAVDPLHVEQNLLLAYLPHAKPGGIQKLFGGQNAL